MARGTIQPIQLEISDRNVRVRALQSRCDQLRAGFDAYLPVRP